MDRMGRHLVFAASWRVTAEIGRRHPDLLVLETHPGGGQYDCLSIIGGTPPRIPWIALNREGSAHFHRSGSEPMSSLWNDVATTSDLKPIVVELEQRAGLPKVGPLPTSTPSVIVYRLVAHWLAEHVFDRDLWDCRNGVYDSSGDEGGRRTDWVAAFPAASKHLAAQESDDAFPDPAYRFWFLIKNDAPFAAFESSTGTCWASDGNTHYLPALYADCGRSIGRLSCNVFGQWLR